MKKKLYLSGALLVLMLASCAKESDPQPAHDGMMTRSKYYPTFKIQTHPLYTYGVFVGNIVDFYLTPNTGSEDMIYWVEWEGQDNYEILSTSPSDNYIVSTWASVKVRFTNPGSCTVRAKIYDRSNPNLDEWIAHPGYSIYVTASSGGGGGDDEKPIE